jgi:hypothetical protein
LLVLVQILGFGVLYSGVVAALVVPGRIHFSLSLALLLYPAGFFVGLPFFQAWGLGKKAVRFNLFIMSLGFLFLGFASFISHAYFYLGYLMPLASAVLGFLASSLPMALKSFAEELGKKLKWPLLNFGAALLCAGLALAGVLSAIFGVWAFLAMALVPLVVLFQRGSVPDEADKTVMPSLSPMKSVRHVLGLFKHKSTRIASMVFVLFQVGLALYFQYILMALNASHEGPKHVLIAGYGPHQLGLFVAFFGLSLLLGLYAGVLKTMTKIFDTQAKALIMSLMLLFVAVLGSGFMAVDGEAPLMVWFFALVVGVLASKDFLAILSLFLSAFGKDQQAEAIQDAWFLTAVSWGFSGFLALFAEDGHALVGVGGVLLLGALWAVCVLLLVKAIKAPPAGQMTMKKK